MPTFVHRTSMPVSAAALYAWHLRPGAFERLVPPWERVEVLERSGPIGEGTRVVLRIRKGLLRVRWEALHDGFVAGCQFRDTQRRGPFRRWVHTHRFADDGSSAALLSDEIDYQLPCGPLGAALLGRGIGRDLQRAFEFRHARTRNDLLRHAACAERPRLRVVISGASGLVGSALAAFLSTGGHRVDRLVRRATTGAAPNDYGGCDVPWNPAGGEVDAAALEGADAVVHLAGENIAGGRWTPDFKQRIRASRVETTALLARTLAGLQRPPRTLLCASATGYYGDRGADAVDEDSPPGSGFLADVCRTWEAAAEPARAAGLRVVHLRLGVVISGRGGALAKMLTPFRWGVGGVVGSGRQVLSWIGLDDLVYAMHQALFDPRLTGAVNAVAPTAVTNREFTRALGRVLRRPTILPLPACAVRLLLGEMGQALLLDGARVQPRRLVEVGFEFVHADIEAALRAELGVVRA